MAGGHLAMARWVRSDRTVEDLALFLGLFALVAVAWGASAWLVCRRSVPVRWIFIGALLLRAAALPAGYDSSAGAFQRLLLYDEDIWRYLWEGHSWSTGVDPLKTAPAPLEEYELELTDPALHAQLFDRPEWGEVWDNIGYPQFASPYGWTAHAVFAFSGWIAPASVVALKVLLLLFDLGVIWLLVRIGREYLAVGTSAAAIYGWCPTPVKEIAGSGHLDSVLVFFLLLSVWGLLASRRGIGGAACALAGLVKPTGWVLAPLLWRRLGVLALVPAVAAASLLAWHTPEGMKAYAEHWVFNPLLGRFLPELRWLEVGFALATTGGVALWRMSLDDGTAEAAVDYVLWTLGAFLLTTPMLAPWYLCWILPFAALRRSVFWLTLGVTVFVSYAHYVDAGNSAWVFLFELGVPLGLASMAWHLRTTA